MLKLEQRFTTELQKWMRANIKQLPFSFAWEVKVSTDNNALAFSAVQEHQIRALEIAKWDAFVYKFSDLDRLQKPCDGVMVSGAGVLIFHWVRKGNKKFYLIDVDRFTQYRDSSKKKSLTESEAESIAFFIGTLA